MLNRLVVGEVRGYYPQLLWLESLHHHFPSFSSVTNMIGISRCARMSSGLQHTLLRAFATKSQNIVWSEVCGHGWLMPPPPSLSLL